MLLSSCRVSTNAVTLAVGRSRIVSAAATAGSHSYLYNSTSSHVSNILTRPNKWRFQSTVAVAQESASASTNSSVRKETKVVAPFVPTDARKYEYFTNVEVTSSGVAIVQFDGPKKAVNTISFAMAEEAKKLWQFEIESNTNVKAVVFTSAKPGMFIAGADIFDIQRITDKQ